MKKNNNSTVNNNTSTNFKTFQIWNAEFRKDGEIIDNDSLKTKWGLESAKNFAQTLWAGGSELTWNLRENYYYSFIGLDKSREVRIFRDFWAEEEELKRVNSCTIATKKPKMKFSTLLKVGAILGIIGYLIYSTSKAVYNAGSYALDLIKGKKS